ncbi:UBAP1-MVB12-associated (UMA)-domain containing protein 1 isoform X4 [Gopherus evgoodei]|uniref:UBAP1-MVB12-associated (UMA)-domain containing protein 1 isoform X4 n=1 Tax=Gopherus evgoodei TaxID=1825980 RepID=UPI0011CFE403|nr:UBAP1-MVB12-associated (UMA)-domain containing protein 1 isoform X4 [Gopherus evgoodei]
MDLFFWVEPGRQPSARNPLALGVACAACHSSLGNAPPWNQERIGKSLAESSCLATNGHSTPRWSRSSEGLEWLCPQVRDPVPPWDLNLVLARLMKALFKPLVSCSLLLLSWKVVFLVEITSTRRVSEIRALPLELPYTVFFMDKVQLQPHPAFQPKVVL